MGLGAIEPAPEMTATDAFPFFGAKGDQPSEAEAKGEKGALEAVYDVVEGEPRGGALILARAPGDGPGVWQLSRRNQKSGALIDESTVALEDSGDVVLRKSLNHERGVRVMLDPPIRVLPKKLEAGAPLSQAAQIRLPYIKTPSKLRERGDATSELTLLGRQSVRVMGKDVEAFVVREVFTSKLQAATAVRTTDRWYAPGLGLVAERWQEEVTALGLVVERSGRAILLRGPPGAAASKSASGG